MKSLLIILTLSASALVTLQCTWSGNQTAEAKFSLNEFSEGHAETLQRDRPSKNNPETIGKMHCYFISVSGNGVSPTVGSQQLNTRKPECFGLGNTSAGIKLSELTSAAGYRFRIPLGANRQVSVYGAYSSTLGTTCTGKGFGDLFGYDARPRIYLLGRTTTHLYRDTAVEVVNSYDSTTADDLAETCPVEAAAKSEPGDPTASPPLRRANLIVATETDGQKSNLFSFSINESGDLTSRQSVYMQGTPKKLHVTPDFTRMLNSFVFQIGLRASINAQIYRVETQGDNAGDFTYISQGTGGAQTTEGHFTIDPKFPYAHYCGGTRLEFVPFSGDTLKWDLANSPGESELAGVVSVGPYVYALKANHAVPGGTTIAAYRRSSSNGALTLVNAAAFSLSMADAAPGELFWDGSRTLHFTLGNSVYSFLINDGDGSLLQQGPTSILPDVSAHVQSGLRMQLNAGKDKLYILTQDKLLAASGPSGIAVFDRSPTTGTISATPSRIVELPYAVQDFQVDPSGKLAFVAKQLSGELQRILIETGTLLDIPKTFSKNIVNLQIIPVY